MLKAPTPDQTKQTLSKPKTVNKSLFIINHQEWIHVPIAICIRKIPWIWMCVTLLLCRKSWPKGQRVQTHDQTNKKPTKNCRNLLVLINHKQWIHVPIAICIRKIPRIWTCATLLLCRRSWPMCHSFDVQCFSWHWEGFFIVLKALFSHFPRL